MKAGAYSLSLRTDTFTRRRRFLNNCGVSENNSLMKRSSKENTLRKLKSTDRMYDEKSEIMLKRFARENSTYLILYTGSRLTSIDCHFASKMGEQ